MASVREEQDELQKANENTFDCTYILIMNYEQFKTYNSSIYFAV